MSVCIHGNVCKEYFEKYKVILSVKCPKDCPHFKEKKEDKKD